eukprot:3364157-Amphidinium_carterae.1
MARRQRSSESEGPGNEAWPPLASECWASLSEQRLARRKTWSQKPSQACTSGTPDAQQPPYY